MGKEEARAKLRLAKKQLERVQIACWDPKDAEEAVTWAFYAYENAVIAVVEKQGMQWQKTHPSKVNLASQLHAQGILSIDVGTKIELFNELRKDVQYGEPGPELESVDLDDLAIELENFIGEVENVITSNDEDM
ncbi:MAG: hypothetical protein E3J66_04580 [Dehalococcoidia bacterium]|nr:MAG: hypothetical protein E3J66_04580 [Dehalococcoidia bacterium]